MNQPLKITQEHAKQAVLNNEFPECTINVVGVPFTFKFTDRTLPIISDENQLQFMEKVLCCKSFSGNQFVRKLPPVIYKELLQIFLDFQTTTGTQLFHVIEEYANTAESRNYWEIFKMSRPELVLNFENNKFNVFQRKWILLNTIKDKQDNVELINSVFDVLKPWLNLELFGKLQEITENQRENIFYNEEDMSKEDARIRKKAHDIKRTATNKNSLNNLDEISIEGE